VAEVHSAGGEFFDFGEGFIGLVGGGVRGGGRDVPAGLSGDDVDVVDGVADEQRVVGWGVEDAVPVGVARIRALLPAGRGRRDHGGVDRL
jgi:hypothetical protein